MTSGWATRYIGLSAELHKRYHVTFFAPGDTSLLAQQFPGSEVAPSTSSIISGKTATRLRLAGSLLRPRKQSIYLYGFDYYPELDSLLRNSGTNWNLEFYFGMGSYVLYGNPQSKVPAICDFCDSQLRHLAVRRSVIRTWRKASADWAQRLYVTRIKRFFIPQSLRILAITDEDRRHILKALPQNTVFVVPNGVQRPSWTIDASYIEAKWRSPYILFSGSLDYEPNVQSVIFTLQQIWPQLKERFPHLIFRVVGRNPLGLLARLGNPQAGIEIIGNVPDMSDYYRSAKLLLCPMFSGGGMKNKVLEALATATPVVTTPEGTAGLRIPIGLRRFVREPPPELRAAARMILEAPLDKYSGWAREALKAAEEYTWERVGHELSLIIESMASSTSAASCNCHH